MWDACHSMACQVVPCPDPGSEPVNPGLPKWNMHTDLLSHQAGPNIYIFNKHPSRSDAGSPCSYLKQLCSLKYMSKIVFSFTSIYPFNPLIILLRKKSLQNFLPSHSPFTFRSLLLPVLQSQPLIYILLVPDSGWNHITLHVITKVGCLAFMASQGFSASVFLILPQVLLTCLTSPLASSTEFECDPIISKSIKFLKFESSHFSFLFPPTPIKCIGKH